MRKDREADRPRRRDAVANRDRILEAAVIAVKREGLKVPMATIANDAGVGIGTVYRHFPDRDALLLGLTERSFRLVLGNAHSAAQMTTSPVDAICAFLETTIKCRHEFVLPLHGGPIFRHRKITQLQADIRTTIERVLQRGSSEGSIRDDLAATDVILFGAMLAQPLVNITEWDLVARRQAEIFLAGIRHVDIDRLPNRARRDP